MQSKTAGNYNGIERPDYSLQPVSHLKLKGVRPDNYHVLWAQIQSATSAEGVIIAMSASYVDADNFAIPTGGPGVPVRMHLIVQLSWGDLDSSPSFVLRAKLEDDVMFFPVRSPRDVGNLEGDYLVIHWDDGIFVWNWKDDTVCSITGPDRHGRVQCYLAAELGSG